MQAKVLLYRINEAELMGGIDNESAYVRYNPVIQTDVLAHTMFRLYRAKAKNLYELMNTPVYYL